ncbi:MAG TPA: L-lactate permease [Candidatus Dormibacteraeota bacterium]|nr:L-lactate permease [Candidatus Dormibacteraeota bacterium]
MSGTIAILAFHQVYQPFGGSILLSAIVAGIPLYILFVMLAVLRLPAWMSALAAMLSAAVLAAVVWGMPLGLDLSATTEGMANGLWPISWIVLNAVFFHNLTIASGDFDVIRRSLTRLTEDRRVQALLVAFCFGALMEGIAGFGAPVAISAAILASLGFEPISAAVLALLANTAPVAFGSIGIPIVTLGLLTAPIIGHSAADQTQVTLALSSMVGRQLPIFSILIPGFLIVVLAGWKRMVEVLPAVLTAGVVFAVVQFLVSNFIGPELTDVLAALVSMAAVALLLRVWKPKTLWGFAADRVGAPVGATPRFRSVGAAVAQVVDSPGRIARAYMMYVILVVVILIGQMGNLPFFSGSPPGNVKNALHTPANITADLKCGQPTFALCPNPWFGPSPTKDAGAFKFPFWRFQWPGSYSGTSAKPKPLISQEPQIVTKSTPYPITFTWDFLSAAGSLVLFAAIIAFIVMAIRGAPLRLFFATYGRTLRQLALPIMTIAFILGIAAVMNFSGMTSTLALLMAKAGGFFPFFSAVIGALGVFLTGSDTASNTLFGPMQAHTAQQIVISGHQLNPILTAGTNSSGGVMGKMISPQNLSVGAAGVNRVGSEGEIFRRTIGYSLILTAAVGIVAMIEVYLVPGIIPTLN